jgi:hypothetical protein
MRPLIHRGSDLQRRPLAGEPLSQVELEKARLTAAVETSNRLEQNAQEALARSMRETMEEGTARLRIDAAVASGDVNAVQAAVSSASSPALRERLQPVADAALEQIQQGRRGGKLLETEQREEGHDRLLDSVEVKRRARVAHEMTRRVTEQQSIGERQAENLGSMWTLGEADDAVSQLARLTPTQRSVLEWAKANAEVRSNEARPALLARARRHGYGEAEVERVLEFIRDEAPAQIHFPPTKRLPSGATVLDSLLATGEFYNQYQSGVSGGTLDPRRHGRRDEYERKTFGGRYHDGVKFNPAERPRYAVLNAEALKVAGASQYGWAVLELKQAVKARMTLTPTDSGNHTPAQLGTPDHARHVLAHPSLRDDRFLAIFRHVLEGQNAQVEKYLEGQVHGSVLLGLDAGRLLEPVSFSDSAQSVVPLAKRYRIPLRWTDGNRLAT